MASIEGPPAGAIRNRAITDELKEILTQAADTIGAETVRVTSGGQTSSREPARRNVPGGWTGSRRHDNGRAADLQLIKAAKTLKFTDADGGEFEAFVTAAAARGATGIGAGVSYMGNKTIHVGFGTSVDDKSQVVWGAGGKAANAPAWLKAAAQKGWSSPQSKASRFRVVARDGLRLRNGPGLEFRDTRMLEAGRELSVLGFDGPGREWARVDLQADGLLDGHVLAAFLRPTASNGAGNEAADEPDDAR